MRQGDQNRRPDCGSESRDQHRITNDMRVRPILLRQGLGQPAPKAERCELRDKFDDQDRIGKAAQHLWSVKSPRDEQEGDTRSKPQHEAEHIGPAALGERLQIGFVLRRGFRAGIDCHPPSELLGIVTRPEADVTFRPSAAGKAMFPRLARRWHCRRAMHRPPPRSAFRRPG